MVAATAAVGGCGGGDGGGRVSCDAVRRISPHCNLAIDICEWPRPSRCLFFIRNVKPAAL